MKTLLAILLTHIWLFTFSNTCLGVSLSGGLVTFDQNPFINGIGTPSLTMADGIQSSSYQINYWNDKTGAVLTGAAPTGDLPDMTITTSGTLAVSINANSTPLSGRLTTAFTFQSGSDHFTQNHGMNTSVPVGTVWENTFTLRFSQQVSITAQNLSGLLFSSLNTKSGTSWEYSHIGILDVNGNPFSPETTESWAGSQATAPLGWLYANDRNTITLLSDGSTISGSTGINDTPSTFSPTNLGISPTIQIGGFMWKTYTEKIGTNAGTNPFTSVFTQFNVIGGSINTTGTPEPARALLICIGLIGVILHRRRS